MINALSIRDIVLIERLDIALENGLTVLTGDILSNGVFYAACLAKDSRRPRLRAALAGAAAGYAAYKLPPLLGLGESPRSSRRSNRAMTVAWYAIGGLVAATLYAKRRR